MSITTYTSCLRIERTDGFIICLTDLDKDILINDSELSLGVDTQTYLSAAGYTPTNMQSTSDNSVNNADVEGVLSAVGVQRNDIIGGRYDFAILHIFLWDYTNNVLIKKLGKGRWGEVTLKDGSYTAEFRSLTQQIQQNIGRTFNPECDDQLGGERCTIALGLFPKEGSITALSSKTSVVDAYLGMPDDYWNNSMLSWTSGVNIAESSLVTDYTLATKEIILATLMPNYIAKGDAYTITKNEITTNTTTDSGSTLAFTDTSLLKADNYFNNAQLTMTSGLNNTDVFTINTYISDKITLLSPALNLFHSTDTYEIIKEYTGSITSIVTPDTIFEDNTRTEADNYFNTLVLTFGTTTNGNDGVQVLITNFISSTGQFTIDDTNLVGILAIGDTYTIAKPFVGSITDIDRKTQFADSTLTKADGYYSGMTVEFNTTETAIIVSYINNIITIGTPTSGDILGYTYDIDYIRTSSTTEGESNILIEDSSIGVTNYVGMYLQPKSGLNEGDFRIIANSQPGLITLGSAFDEYMHNSDTYVIINMVGNTYMSIGKVESVTNNAKFICTALTEAPYADDYFNYGKLVFKSGLNDELHMEVKDFNGTTGEFTLFLPMAFEISVGDSFQVFAGCDKRLTTCKNKFSNHINYQGFPYIPGSDAINTFGGQ